MWHIQCQNLHLELSAESRSLHADKRRVFFFFFEKWIWSHESFFEIYNIVITDTHFMYQTLTLCIFYATFVCNYFKQIHVHVRDRKLIASLHIKKQYLVIFLASLQIKNIPSNISCIFTNNETISHNVWSPHLFLLREKTNSMSASIYNNKAGISKVLCIFFMIDECIIMINEGEPYYIYFYCVLTTGVHVLLTY